MSLSKTKLTLYQGVKMTPDYNHTKWYATNDNSTFITQQTSFFASLPQSSLNEYNLVKRDGLNITIKVKLPPPNSTFFNYARIDLDGNTTKVNGAPPVYYCFITNKRMVQKDLWEYDLIIDVMQTFLVMTTFTESFVERRLLPQYNIGKPYLYPHDEQLDYGGSYQIKTVKRLDFTKGLKWLVILAKQRFDVDENLNPYNEVQPTLIGGVPQPLTYYFLPFRNDYAYSGDGRVVTEPTRLLSYMYKAVGAQNNIVSIHVTEHMGLTFTYNGQYPPQVGNSGLTLLDPTQFDVANFYDEDTEDDARCYILKNITTFTPLSTTINWAEIYPDYTAESFSKLMISPYTKFALTDNQGGFTEFKPELFKNLNRNSGSITFNMRGSTGLNNKTSVYTNDYANTMSLPENLNEIMDMYGIVNNETNDIPIVTDMLSAFLQGNRNSVANSKLQAQFNVVAGAVGSVGSIVSNGHNPVGALGAGVQGGLNMLNNQFAVESINAQIKDINNVPPNISNLGMNTFYSYGNSQVGYYFIVYEILPEFKSSLEAYFKRYGYKYNRASVLTRASMKSRSKWDYYKIPALELQGMFETVYVDKMKEIFRNGITLWHGTHTEMCNYNTSND